MIAPSSSCSLLRFSVVALLLCASFRWGLAQNNPSHTIPDPFLAILSDPNADYLDAVARVDSFFDANPDLKTTPGSGYKTFKRWRNYWETRTYNGEGARGDMKHASEALVDRAFGGSTGCTSHGNWQLLGPKGIDLQIYGVASMVKGFSGNVDHVYAGSSTGGLFVTENATAPDPSWESIMDASGLPAVGIRDLVIDPSNPNVMYMSTGFVDTYGRNYGIGAIKSTDDGTTWNPMPGLSYAITNFEEVRKMIMHPTNHNILYAVTRNQAYKTTDAGASWNSLYWINPAPGVDPNFLDIEFSPLDLNNILVSGQVIYRFEGGSGAWISLNSGHYKCCPQYSLMDVVDTKIYLSYGYEPSLGWQRYFETSTDEGDTWVLVDGNLERGTVYEVNEASPDFQYMEMSNRVFGRSTNFGADFDPISEYYPLDPFNGTSTHADIRSMDLVGSSVDGLGDHLLVGNDGGVLLSFTSGLGYLGWKNISGVHTQPLQINQFYGYGGHPFRDWHAGGTQDNGIFVYKDGDWAFSQIGDGYSLVWDPLNESYAYSSQNENLLRSPDAGVNWIGCELVPPGFDLKDRPLAIDNEGSVYVGYRDIKRSTDHGLTWNYITNFASSHLVPACYSLKAITPAPTDREIIYAAFGGPTYNQDPTSGPGCALYQCTWPVRCPLVCKLFRTTDYGVSWEDLTPNVTSAPGDNDAFRASGATSICVDPEDPYRIWVSFGNFEEDYFSGTPVNRVLYSPDGGYRWEDVSNGLPNFPVNKIVYQNGTDDLLYAATDVGVFYRKAGMSAWECFQNHLPIAIVSDLTINYCKGTLIASTYGRGVWESPLLPNAIPTLVIASTPAPWTGTVNLTSDVEVLAGATLTVQGHVNIPVDRKIIVRRGAKLVVDGGTLTNDCNGLWAGIEVEGNRNISQYTPSAHGIVELKNNAVIANARDAITTIRTDAGTWNWDYTGGIIRAENSSFINCRKAVQFLPYQNFFPTNTPANQRRNNSYFHNCTFETNAPIRSVTYPSTFVSMDGVYGVTFRGCDFRNTVSWTTMPWEKRGKGIVAIDATMRLDPLCPTGCSVPDKNLFTGLYYGVDATTTGLKVTNFPVRIDDNRFENNLVGAYLGGHAYSAVVRNSFMSPAWIGFVGSTLMFGTGAYLDHCDYIKAEGNTFQSYGTGGICGLYVNNSDPLNCVPSLAIGVSNQVYSNAFSNLYVGMLAGNDNDGPAPADGLRIRCNDFIGNDFDIAVAGTPDNLCTDIAKTQGFCSPFGTKQVGNTYHSCAPGTAVPDENFSVNKASLQTIKHAIHPSPGNCNPACRHGLVTVPAPCGPAFVKTLHCPSTLSTPLTTVLSTISSLRMGIQSKQQRLDNGAAAQLYLDINGGLPVNQLKSKLLSLSPYLDDGVLLAMLNRNPALSSSFLKEVLIANSPLTSPLVNAVTAQVALFTQQDYATVMAAQTGGTPPRQALMEEIDWDKADLDDWMADKTRYYLEDTSSLAYNTVVTDLAQDTRLTSKYLLASLYIHASDPQAQSLITAITNDPVGHNVGVYFNTLRTVYNGSTAKSYALPNFPNDLAYIQVTANLLNDMEGLFAGEWLAKIQGYVPFREFILPEGSGSKLLANAEERTDPASSILAAPKLKIFPNPAGDVVTLEVSDLGSESGGLIKVTDVYGNPLPSISLKQEQSRYVLDIRSWAQGVYVLHLVTPGYSEKQRLVVVR